jgi:hypothetical protein
MCCVIKIEFFQILTYSLTFICKYEYCSIYCNKAFYLYCAMLNF